MATSSYEPTDRRPIASRERVVWQKAAAWLAARRVSPNAISLAGMAAGIAAGVLFAGTSYSTCSCVQRAFWLFGAALVQLRLLANMLDGMVALASHRASPVGELYNELPDRVSDIAIFVGAGYASGGHAVLGYCAACVAVLTAYVRAVGKAAGASNLFVGPMAKQQRMFVFTLVAVAMALLPRSWQPVWGESQAGLVALALGVIIIGGLITVTRRIGLIVRHLKGAA